MGGYIETNDTLQITTEQGFPEDILNLEKHQESPIKLEDIKDKIFEFHNKPNARIYQQAPNRNFLVHNIEDIDEIIELIVVTNPKWDSKDVFY